VKVFGPVNLGIVFALPEFIITWAIAELGRNIGKCTLADILAYRNDPEKSRVVGAL
jgi:cation/acetate symporter